MTDDLHGRRIDVHTHSGAMPNIHFLDSADDLVQVERDAGVEKAIVSSARAVFYDMVTGNADTFAVTRESPMLYMYVYVDPHRVDASLAEMEKYKPVDDRFKKQLTAKLVAVRNNDLGNSNTSSK